MRCTTGIAHTGIEARRGTGRREEERDIVRWCFADRKMADDFATVFGASTATSSVQVACRK